MKRSVLTVFTAILGMPLSLTAMTEPNVLTGDSRVHDPTMIRTPKGYYVLSTGDENGVGDGSMQIRYSKDLRDWRFLGTVFKTQPDWIRKTLGTSPPNLWAPDVSVSNGKYLVYYAASSFGSNNSAIGLVSNVTLDPDSPKYRWVDEGLVFSSSVADNFNAIDPDRIVDQTGTPWLVFGSFWDGIKMLRLDAKTNKPSGRDKTVYALASRAGGPIEAPSIVYHDGFYYLFVSFDFCCKGLGSSYRIMVGRAKNITGPYLDQTGARLDQGAGTEVLSSHGRIIGPGGQDMVQDGAQTWLVHHYYDGDTFGDPRLDVRLIRWRQGWPEVKPRSP